ncbi:MAG TPA: MBL fold metallo-hydrolase [Opitutaceae bacterium]|nr:MBL fold metallo-hydrolase [Opitutaceae bacterium]
MEVIVLGSGTSQGVPMIGCGCPVCTSADLRNRRTRASVHVVMDGLHVQVDAAPEFRLQCLDCGVDRLDLFILTHGHSDHVAGMDDLRRFCDLLGGKALAVYSTDEGMARILAIYPYAIMDRPIVRGYPAFRLEEMPGLLELPQGSIRSTLLPHGGTQTLGLVFAERSSGKRFAYYTDCKSLTGEAVELAIGCDALILDGLRPLPHPSHMSIGEAVKAGRALGAKGVWLTHLTHLTDHAAQEAELPDPFRLAYDGQRIRL